MTGKIGTRSLRVLSGWVPWGDEFDVAPDGRRVALARLPEHLTSLGPPNWQPR